MDDAQRYKRELDRLLLETAAEAKRREGAHREEIWKIMDSAFNDLWDHYQWSDEKRAVAKKDILDYVFAYRDNQA
jgi:hypothetical protein